MEVNETSLKTLIEAGVTMEVHYRGTDLLLKGTDSGTGLVSTVRNRWKTTIAPELTGKPSQFGSIQELLDLKKETRCAITIDFAHQQAREQGKIDYEDIIF